MKNILFICTLSLISRGLCYCQEIKKEMRHDTAVSQTERKSLSNSIMSLKNKLDTNNSDLQVYQCVLSEYGANNHMRLIFDSTYLETFKQIDLKKQGIKNWHRVDGETPNWEPFFDSISTSSLKEFKINAKTIAGYSVVGRDSIKKSRLSDVFYLSPVIYSADHTLAICTVLKIRDPLNENMYISAMEYAFLLQFKDKKWKVATYLLVSST